MADRRQVMNFRVQAQQLDRAQGTLGDTAILDIGVQDTGPDGARWALPAPGVDVTAKVMPEPYLRLCRPCNATHPYEMPFRLAAAYAGTAPTPAPRLLGTAPTPRTPPAADGQSWAGALAARLRDAGQPVHTSYPVGTWRLDLSLTAG